MLSSPSHSFLSGSTTRSVDISREGRDTMLSDDLDSTVSAPGEEGDFEEGVQQSESSKMQDIMSKGNTGSRQTVFGGSLFLSKRASWERFVHWKLAGIVLGIVSLVCSAIYCLVIRISQGWVEVFHSYLYVVRSPFAAIILVTLILYRDQVYRIKGVLFSKLLISLALSTSAKTLVVVEAGAYLIIPDLIASLVSQPSMFWLLYCCRHDDWVILLSLFKILEMGVSIFCEDLFLYQNCNSVESTASNILCLSNTIFVFLLVDAILARYVERRNWRRQLDRGNASA